MVTSSCASMHLCTNVDLMSYAASKTATDHIVGMLAAKVGRFGIRINGINPGCTLSLSQWPLLPSDPADDGSFRYVGPQGGR